MKFEEMYELARMAHSNYAISKINHSIILIHDCVKKKQKYGSIEVLKTKSKNLFLFLAETKKFTMNNLIILILFLIYSVQSENSIQINYKPITDWNRKIKISFFKESKLCAE